MKSLFLTITLAAGVALAQDGTQTRLPPGGQQTPPPKPTQAEGTETRLKDQQREDLKKWAYNSLIALQNLKRDSLNLPKPDAKQKLMTGFRDISKEAEGRLNELLMRFTLNKALDIVNELEGGMKTNHRFLDDAAVRVLQGFIQIAEDFYDSDIKLIERLEKGGTYEPEYLKYSLRVAVLMNTYVESVPDIASQYNLYNKMLGYFHVDMARTRRDKVVAPIAYPIDEFLRKSGLPEFVTFDRTLAKKGRDFLPESFWYELPNWHKNLREMRKIFLHYYDLAVKTYELNKPI